MSLTKYGVAVGTLLSFTRDNPDQFGKWYHGHIALQTPDGVYQSAIDVDTPSGVGVSYRLIPAQPPSAFGLIPSLADGFHGLAATNSSGALDYLRHPALQDPPGCIPFIPDPLIELVGRLFGIPRIFPWVPSDGDNALNALQGALAGASRVFILGEHYTSGLGIHDVHMNQGDPPGSQWWSLDGIWQDGGVLIETAAGLSAWLVRFNTQSLTTDAQGHPL